MKVDFTAIDVSYACDELGRALRGAIPKIKELARQYEKRDDERTLILVLLCPCCRGDIKLDTENAILVSPFYDIEPRDYKIYQVNLWPPYCNPGEGNEAKSVEEYLEQVKTTIDKALLS